MRLIDADALIEKAIEEKKFVFTRDSIMDDIRGEKVCETVYKDLHEFIASAPTIEAEPVRHGEWLDFEQMKYRYRCSACGIECYVATVMGVPCYKYCPYCGAKMDGDKNDE